MTPRARSAEFALRPAIVVLCLVLGGCIGQRGGPDITGSTGGTDMRAAVDQLGQRYERNPGEKHTSLAYARALRSLDQRAQAVAVLQTAAIKAPTDSEILTAYGKALADAGRFKEAMDVLGRAHTPDRPNWRVLSTQGAILDQIGEHAAARQYYENALKIAPGEPTVLSNLGLSHALSKDLSQAEAVMAQAAAHPSADPRVRANYALVLALLGRFSESEAMARKDLSPDDAAANISYVRSMMSQQNNWQKLQQMDKAKQRNAKRAP
jgi:Flp pilus assembly protein TadD